MTPEAKLESIREALVINERYAALLQESSNYYEMKALMHSTTLKRISEILEE